MLDSIFSEGTSGIDLVTVLVCSLVSIVLGFIIAIVYKYTERGSKHFLVSLSVLPLIVQTIIMLVNGNLGMSVAIAGAFSLIRFRSIAGTSKEIVAVFLAMTIGVALGMGYILFATIVTIMALFVWFVLVKSSIFDNNDEKILKVTIPENIDYTSVFDDIFKKYLNKYELIQVKTTNMGSLFDLSYRVYLKKDIDEKKFLDDVRVRNANLKVMLSHPIENEML
jgi:hypothetical protein